MGARWETDNRFDPLYPQDANEDADEDGLTNRDEQDAGTATTPTATAIWTVSIAIRSIA